MQISEVIEKLIDIKDSCGDVECLIEVCDEQTGIFTLIPVGDVDVDDRDRYGTSVLFMV